MASHTPDKTSLGWFDRFVHSQVSGSIVLMVCTVIALVWANSPWSDGYFRLAGTYIGVTWGDLTFEMSLSHWIMDGLMAIFFFVVGLEIKREIVLGELSSVRKSFLPVSAAVGGAVVPAAIYVAFNAGTVGATGWGVPMATDIVFALGVLACGVWLGVLISGVHATIAGVIVARVVPVRSRIEPSAYLQRLRGGLGLLEKSALTRDSVVSNAEQQKALGRIYFATDDMMPVGLRFEKQLHPMQAFLILPLFALFSAGVTFDAETLADASGAVGWGIVIGLFVGKQIGVTLAGWLAIRSGRADMPEGVTWSQLWGVSCLAGIGFTMSIFVTGLAFSDATLISEAKIGILAGLLLSGVAGYVVLRKALPNH